jgi:hypothetical protein
VIASLGVSALVGCASPNPLFDESEAGGGTRPSAGDDGGSDGIADDSATSLGTGGMDSATTADSNPTVGNTTDADTGADTGSTIDCASPTDCAMPSDATRGECNPYAQDCDAGRKCVPVGNNGDATWSSTSCVTIAVAPKQLGEPCNVNQFALSGEDDCDLGLLCWAVDPVTLQGVCRELCGCSADTPTCQGGGTCFVANDGLVAVCSDPCDPLLADCGSGLTCIPPTAGGGPTYTCQPDASDGMNAPGSPCEFANECGPGLACVTTKVLPGCELAPCCAEFCDPEAGCGNLDQVCHAAELPFVEPECAPDVGICGVP